MKTLDKVWKKVKKCGIFSKLLEVIINFCLLRYFFGSQILFNLVRSQIIHVCIVKWLLYVYIASRENLGFFIYQVA